LDGKPGVIEYSEIDRNSAVAVDPKTKKLVYGDSHICMNMYSVPFLRKIAATRLKSMPYHIAKKKIPCADDSGKTVPPKDINGWKMEQFIFDIFDLAEHMVAFEINRDEEFSPLKNGPGAKADCPETCRKMLSDLHKKWIRNAGGNIAESTDPNALCEVAPALSYNGEGLESLVKGKTFNLPLHLH
jgi:UDP-N-acetylglucosamine/UDP-N-acetylgalactosamine diphosphorylase